MVEWLPLRRTPDSLPLKPYPDLPLGDHETPNTEKRQHEQETETDNSPNMQTAQHTSSHIQQPPPRTPSSRNSGARATPVELKFQNQHVKRLSIAEVDHWRQSRSSLDEKMEADYKNRKVSMSSQLTSTEFPSMPSPPALKHRPQKHRGRAGDPDTTRPKERSKNQRRVSWDSEKILNPTSVEATTDNIQLQAAHSEFDIDTPTNRKPKSSSIRRTADVGPLAQTVTHFTMEIIDGLGQIMAESEEDAENWREELDRIQSMGSFDNPDWRYATARQRQAFPFIAQSVFFVFSSARQILKSFGKDVLQLETSHHKAVVSRLDVPTLRESLQRLFSICPWDIALHSLWTTLDKLFVPPDHSHLCAEFPPSSVPSSTIASSAPPVVRRLSESATEEHFVRRGCGLHCHCGIVCFSWICSRS